MGGPSAVASCGPEAGASTDTLVGRLSPRPVERPHLVAPRAQRWPSGSIPPSVGDGAAADGVRFSRVQTWEWNEGPSGRRGLGARRGGRRVLLRCWGGGAPGAHEAVAAGARPSPAGGVSDFSLRFGVLQFTVMSVGVDFVFISVLRFLYLTYVFPHFWQVLSPSS